MVMAPPGHLLVNFDLAQAETWIVAYLANEPTMKHVLATGDIHRETAQKALRQMTDAQWEALPKDEMKTERYKGKQNNHGTAYRMGPNKATEVINKQSDKPPYVVVTVAEMKINQENWHNYYHIKGWWDEIEFQLNQNRTLKTPYGRLQYFFGQWGEALFREATAFVPQCTVAEHLNGAIQKATPHVGGLIEVDRQFVIPGYIKIINQSHDSILCEIPQGDVLDIAPQIAGLLLRPLIINEEEFTIPVDAEAGERWGELVEQKRKVGEYEIKYEL